jgi:hypothetical protein
MGRIQNVDELDLDGFLGHKGSMGGGGAFLKNWKEDGDIVIWLHPKAGIVPLWHHTWYTVGRDKDNKTVMRSIRFNSLEKESILKRRNRRDDDGNREFPPEICPFSKFTEWLYQQVRHGHINWVDEVFLFDEPKDPLVLHAGGILGMFKKGDDELTKEEIRELRQAHIQRTDAWKESCEPRLQYVFRIVRNDDPDAGCLIALEAQALGDSIKTVISDRIDDFTHKHGEVEGKRLGNPFVTPYAIKWAYDEKQSFSKRYAARAMTQCELTPEIQAVFDRDPADIKELTRPSNILQLRQSMEAHWALKDVVPPWDEIFGEAEEELAGTAAVDDDETAFPFGANETQAKGGQPGKVAAAQEPEDDGMVECNVCDGLMPDTVFECPQCGTVYDPKTNNILTRGEWPKPEPKKTRKRGQ